MLGPRVENEPSRHVPRLLPFTDGTRRPIYTDGNRQWTYDNDGERVYGIFLLSEEDRYDLPVIVEALGDGDAK